MKALTVEERATLNAVAQSAGLVVLTPNEVLTMARTYAERSSRWLKEYARLHATIEHVERKVREVFTEHGQGELAEKLAHGLRCVHELIEAEHRYALNGAELPADTATARHPEG